MTDPTAGGQTTETPPTPPFTRPRRRLCRDPRHRRIGGVASGVAAYAGIDTTVVRVLFVIIAAVTGGTAIVGYLLAWALLPEPGDPETRLEARIRERDVVVLVVGAIVALILFGAADSWGGGWGWGWHRLFTPLALVAAGVVLLLHHDRNQQRDPPSPGPSRPIAPTPPVGSADPIGPAEAIGPADPTTRIGAGTGPEDLAAQPAVPPWWAATPAPPVRRRRPSPLLRNATLGIACLFAAGATLLSALDAFDVPARFVLGGMLMIVAGGILVSAWWGRRRGLLGVAFLLAIALAIASVPGLSLAGGIGDRVERPLSLTDVPKAYRLGIGDYEIDLSRLTLPTDRVLRLTAGVGAGRLTIDVPRAAEVDLSGHISAGSLRIDDRDAGLSGVDVDVHRRLPAASDAPHVAVKIDAAFADVEVHRVS